MVGMAELAVSMQFKLLRVQQKDIDTVTLPNIKSRKGAAGQLG